MLIKRLFDLLVAGLGLVLLMPLLIIITIIIKLGSSGPVIFRQKRIGLHGELFYINKFRTMVANSEVNGPKLTVGQDKRITGIGHLLRKTKLDELPQLWNVFCGSMSLVGPRPEVPEYVSFYPENIRNTVLSVRPGITDWASIKMIDENILLSKATNPEQEYINVILPLKLRFAVRYVQNRTLWGDVVIIVATLCKIIKR